MLTAGVSREVLDCRKGTQGNFQVMEMLCILTAVMLTQVYTFVKTLQGINLHGCILFVNCT